MLTKLKFLFHMLKFAKDPTDTMEVFRFSDALIASSGVADRQQFSAVFLEDQASKALYTSGSEDFLRKPFDLQALAAHRPGTLGREYATVMLAAGLDPEFFAYNKVEDAASYFTLRLRKTHDIYHVLTGFRTDVPGEIGLQAFYLGQLHMPVPMSIMVSALLYVIGKRDMAMIKTSCEQIVFGYQAGVRAAKLHGVVWEDLWGTDLGALREQLRITPYTAARQAA